MAYAVRARAVAPDLARLEVVGTQGPDCGSATTNFTLAVPAGQPLAPSLATAAQPDADLRLPLPVRFTGES